jgi:hypothetical protein
MKPGYEGQMFGLEMLQKEPVGKTAQQEGTASNQPRQGKV